MCLYHCIIYLPDHTERYTNDDALIEHDRRWRDAVEVDPKIGSVKVVEPNGSETIWANVPYSIQYVNRT